ncbi:MAG: ATP-binding protein [Oligoflexales bacterium]
MGTVILQRNNYKQKLEEAYQEKLEIISKNTVAHTIANTVQRIAHDIKNPFHMIKLTFNELKAGRIDLQQTFALAAHAEKSTIYVDNLLTDLMAASREKPNKLEPLEINRLIESIWTQSNHIKDRPISLELGLQHSSKLFADRLKVERLFINLFNNGKEAMGSHGSKMWVKTRETTINERPYIEIAIGNEDSFIAEKYREKIFSPVYTAGKKGGTGLGLAICHETVVSHGGQIRCESNKQKNTEFIFTLPSLEGNEF